MLTLKLDEAVPNNTAVVPVKYWPVRVTCVLTAAGPEVGEAVETTGAKKEKRLLLGALLAVPAATVIATAPGAAAGAVTMMVLSLFTVKILAWVPPKLTEVAPVKYWPVIVTCVPARTPPELGE